MARAVSFKTLLLISLLTFAAPLFAHSACVNQPSGLISWWRAENNASDQLGANNGSVQGSGLSYAAGKVGQAFSMNGDGYVQLPAAAGSRSQGTIMLWVNYNSIQDSNQPFGSAEYNFTLLNLKTGYNGVFIFGIQLDFPIGWQYALSSVTPSTGQWYHVAGTWGPEDIKIYVNGELSVNADYTSSSYTGSSVATAYNLIGRFIRDGYPSSTVDGLIDEVALFDRALSASEIAAIYNSGSAGICIDSTPDAFSFIDQTGMPLGTTIVSNPIMITGINNPAPISITGGDYLINSGSWTNADGTVTAGDTVKVRVTSAATNGSTTAATLTIGVVYDTFSVTTAASADPNASDLVSWWKAEGNAYDSVGGNHGTLQGGATFTTGMIGQAFSLDGVDDYVKVNASSSLDVGLSDGFSINMWINPHDISQPQPLIEWNNGSSWGAHFWISVPNSGGGSGSLYANIFDTSGVNHLFSTTTNILTANTYQNVALTYDETTGLASLYLNGIVVASQNLGIVAPQTSYDLFIGLRPNSGITYFNGLIDEVKIFSRVLSAAEVTTLSDIKPDAFSFINQTGMPLSTTIVSNPITVAGISYQTGVSITGGEYQVNGGSWTSSAGMVNNGDTVTVRQTSSAANSTVTTATLTIGGVSAAFNVTTAASDDPNASGLVAWWRAENNALDSVGGNHGILAGSAAFAAGKAGQAFDLSSASDYVSIPDSANLAITDNITVAGWFYPRAFSHGQTIFNRRNDSNVGGVDLELAHYASHSNTIGFYICTSSGWQMLVAPNESITSGTWYHVAGTYNNSMMRLYINGIEVISQPVSGAINNPPAASVRIGSNIPDPSYHFDGLIDELRIYNRALGAGEVARISGTMVDAFSFIDQTGMPLATDIVSNPITVSGNTNPAAISITGDTGAGYRINGGSWTAAMGTVTAGDTVEVKVTSAATNNAMTSATLTIGTVSDTFSVTTAAATDPNATGLVAWYKTENNALDSVGGNHGALMNGATFAGGQAGQAFSFDGVDDYVNVPFSSPLDLQGSLTITAWVNSTSNNSQNRAIAGKAGGYQIFIEAGGLLVFGFYNGSQWTLLHSSIYLSENIWIHVAGTFNATNGTLQIYINGAPNTSLITEQRLSANANPVKIGGFGSDGAPFSGRIDEVKIFSRALSANEVGKLSGMVPEAFTFTDQTGVARSTVFESNVITVTGITYPTAIGITGGEYAVSTNGGSTWGDWTGTAGTVSLNNQVKVHLTSSASYATTLDATLSIGGVSDTFSVTTGPAPTTTTTSTSTSTSSTSTTASTSTSTSTSRSSTTSSTTTRSTTTTSVASTTTTAATTTSSAASTTTTAPKCPFARSSVSTAQAQSLRELRDRLLDTALGALLASRYYQNLDEIADILQADEDLGSRFNMLVRGNMPVVKGLMLHGAAAMPGDDLLEVYGFLLDLQSQAGPKLRMDIDFILRGIELGWLLGWSCITVE